MSDDRKNVKISPDTYRRLKRHMDDDQSWNEFLNALLDGVPVTTTAETVELSDGERDRVARRAADEVEARLRDGH